MPPRPRVRRSSPRRPGGQARVRPSVLASLAVIFGLLFAQLVQLSDLLLFQHSACEHGELVHGPLRAATEAASAPADTAEQRLAAATAGHGDHEHCDATALRHRPDVLAVHVPEATLLDGSIALALDSGSSRRPIALLAVAPKASPPRG